jgi:hypothetical protein
VIVPHARAPPRYSRASSGPSSRNGAQVSKLNRANCTVITPSQVCARNCRQPSMKSCHGERVGGLIAGTRSSVSEKRLTPKVAASMAMTKPGCVKPIMTPDSAGPITLAADCAMPSKALASPSLSPGVIAGVSPPSAGVKNASPVPSTADRTTISQIGGIAAAQHEHHLRYHSCREHKAEIGSRTSAAQDGERHPDRRHRRSEQRRRVSGIEPPEVLMAKHRQLAARRPGCPFLRMIIGTQFTAAVLRTRFAFNHNFRLPERKAQRTQFI